MSYLLESSSCPVGTIAIGGSRRLPESYAPLIDGMVRNILSTGKNRLVVGCCVGADCYAIRSVIRFNQLFDLVDCRTILDEDLNGGCSLTAIGAVSRLAFKADSVTWSNNLYLPLRARLAIRTRSVIMSSDAAVLFFDENRSVGTYGAAIIAAKKGIPIYAFGKNIPFIEGKRRKPVNVFGYDGYILDL